MNLTRLYNVFTVFIFQRCDVSEPVHTSGQRLYTPDLKGPIIHKHITCPEKYNERQHDARMRIFSGTSNPSLAQVLVALFAVV